MFRRFRLLAAPLALVVLFAGCKKSEGNKVENFFGATPTVSELTLTKTFKHVVCTGEVVDTCTLDLCSGISTESTIVDIEQITASAKVADEDGAADLLVVVLRFLDPPVAAPPIATNQISLEMFDNGGDKLGQISGSNIPIISGDQVKGDGIYTRKFYFKSTTTTTSGLCLEQTDFNQDLGAYSVYGTLTDIDSGFSADFTFNIEAIDHEGNIGTSLGTTVSLQASFVEFSSTLAPCTCALYPTCANCVP